MSGSRLLHQFIGINPDLAVAVGLDGSNSPCSQIGDLKLKGDACQIPELTAFQSLKLSIFLSQGYLVSSRRPVHSGGRRVEHQMELSGSLQTLNCPLNYLRLLLPASALVESIGTRNSSEIHLCPPEPTGGASLHFSSSNLADRQSVYKVASTSP